MKLFTSALLIAFPIFAGAQDTWSDIHSVFQAKCAVACHTASNPSGQLILNGTSSQVFANIVGVTPTNPAAAAIGDERIKPGYPERSFLLRKCNNGWDSQYTLTASEGNSMPMGQASLTDPELEKIRQWILFGAPQTGKVVEDSTIQDYYSGLGLPTLPVPPAPSAGQGFQVRLGPFLMEPQTEVEYFKKHELLLPDSIEVNKVEIVMNSQSHHYIIYKFDPGNAGSFPDGLRDPNTSPSGNSVSMVTAAQYPRSFELPQGTAYFWEQSTVLDLNYHIQNLNPDSILAGEAYMNVYTQPKGTAQAQMFSALIPYSQMTNSSVFFIPANAQEKTFTDPFYLNGSQDEINVWLLSTHTHKWGVDYDLYKRNPDGTKGTQLYEGFYDVDYTFNQGYYDWAHPAIKEFDPLETIKLSEGFIQEAKYKNFGNSTAYFGLTTADEMMLFVIQYTVNWTPSFPGVAESSVSDKATLYPNPSNGNSTIRFFSHGEDSGLIQAYSIEGREAFRQRKINISAGENSVYLQSSDFPTAGTYLVKLTTGQTVHTFRLIVEK